MDDMQLIRIALLNHANLCHRQAAGRKMAGPQLASARAAKRAEARNAEEIANNLPDVINRLSGEATQAMLAQMRHQINDAVEGTGKWAKP